MANPVADALMSPFVWGRGGARMTPEQIAREREIADAMMAQGNPAFGGEAGWLGVLGRGLEGAYSGWNRTRAERAEGENATFNRETVAGLLGGLGGGSTASTSPVAAALTGGTPMDPSSARVAAAHSASAAPGQFSGSQQEFVDMLLPAAMEASQRTGIDPRIIVAQAAQETGWGRSAPGNNFFGIKSHGQGGGQTLKTHEYVNGKRVNVSDSFRTFADPSDSVRGYADFILNNPRYKPFMQADGLDAQLEALQASGYATDPNYSRSVGSIARGIALPEQPSQAALESLAVGESMPMPAAAPAQAPAQVAQAGGINPAIIEALSSPYADEGTRRIAGLLLGQHLEQQQQANDPMRALQLERAQLENAALRNPQPKETDDIREYNYARQQGYQGSFTDFMTDMRRAGATNVNVGAGEKAWDQESAKLFAKRYDDISAGAMNAQQMMGMYDLAEQALNSGVRTGLGAEAELTLRQMGAAMGMDTDPEKLAGGELIRAVQNRMALTMRSPDGGMGMPGALSDRDIKFLKDSQIGIDRSPEGNRRMLEAFRAMENRKIEIARLADDYIAQNGRLDSGFNQMVREYASSNPLFPEGPKKITTQDEFNALPSGAEFVAPDGSIRRKP